MSQTPTQKNIIENSHIEVAGNFHQGDVTYINNYFAAQEVKIPHRLTNNIPTNADHILGRAAELKLTKDHLAQNEATILFNGIGGIGKTALATKYMAVYGNEYKHLAWITVQSTLAEAITNNAPLLASLHITQQVQDYIAAKQLDKAFEFLFHKLNQLEQTLVVIDNANDLDDLDQYKNWFDTANCHFLITSRSKPSEWATVEVDSLPEDEAVALFRKLHPSVSADDEAIKSLLSKLFYHTLLIELVAKAGATVGIPFADLQTMIETQFIHHEGLNERVIPKGKHGNFVSPEAKKAKIEEYIWLIFSQVKGLEDSSKLLLKAMALLPVATPFDLDFLKTHFAFFDVPDAVGHLDTLTALGWLQKEQAEGQKPYFKMHPLIGDVVVKQLGVSVNFAKKHINAISKNIYYNNLKVDHNLFEKRKFLPFAERLRDLFSNEKKMEMSRLLDKIGSIEKNFGFYSKACEYKEKALSIASKLLDKEHSTIAIRKSSLALLYRHLGRYVEAADLLESALSIDSKVIDGNEGKIAIRKANLALVYRSLGRYSEAIELLKAAIDTGIEKFGIKSVTVAMRQSHLSLVYQDLKEYEKAISLVENALSIYLIRFNINHPNVASCRVR